MICETPSEAIGVDRQLAPGSKGAKLVAASPPRPLGIPRPESGESAGMASVRELRWWQHLSVLPVVMAIRAYQWLLSRRLPRVCVYEPSCSEYTRLALLRHGLLEGLRLGRARIQRCDGGLFRGVDPPPGYPSDRWTVPEDLVPPRILAQPTATHEHPYKPTESP